MAAAPGGWCAVHRAGGALGGRPSARGGRSSPRPPWFFSLLVGCAVALFSLVRSRSLVAPGRGLGGVPLSAPWWRSVVGLGLSAGAVRWRLRSSVRAFSGAVVVVGFGSPAAASAFASSLGGWCGLSLAVRRFVGASGPVWGVSVPVAVPPFLSLALAPAVLPVRSWWVRG
jgi:hypothetical protein